MFQAALFYAIQSSYVHISILVYLPISIFYQFIRTIKVLHKFDDLEHTDDTRRICRIVPTHILTEISGKTDIFTPWLHNQ